MLFLSGMRGGAFTTLPLKAVNISARTIHQWPELGVNTKNGKRATTFLLPIPELLTVVEAWDTYVRTHLPETAPWYTPVISQWGDQTLSFEDPGKNRIQALNRRLRELYRVVGLPSKSPHKFRHGHAVYGLQHASTMADYKAVSMNLMHHDIEITDSIYAPILTDEVKERINGLASPRAAPQLVLQPDDELQTVLDRLSNADLSKLMLVLAQRFAV
jgi:integrase